MQGKSDGQYHFQYVSAQEIGQPQHQRRSVAAGKATQYQQQAKQLNINLSQALEQHLTEVVRQAQRSLWLAENQNALDEYNRRVESQGTFSDGLRRF